MTTIEVKLHPLTVRNKADVVCYQLCRRQESRQVITDIRISPHQWSGERRGSVVTSDNERTIFSYWKQIGTDLAAIRRIIRELDAVRNEYILSDVIGGFRSPRAETRVSDYLGKETELLHDSGQFSISRNYLRALSSFSSFLKNYNIPLTVLNSDMACKHEKWLWGRRVSKNSSSLYMRILRAAYNKAIQEQLVEQAFPFHEIYIGIIKTLKYAVSGKTILKLQRPDLFYLSALTLSRNLFIFSYSTRGMAFIGTAYLKKKNIGEGVATYYRHKTGRNLALRIEPCIGTILKRHLLDSSEAPHVFPITIDKGPGQVYLQYQAELNYHSQKLKQLGKLIGGTLPLSSYTPRHSWATATHNRNIPIAVISAGTGHTSEKTILIYLDSLGNLLVNNADNGILKGPNSTISW